MAKIDIKDNITFKSQGKFTLLDELEAQNLDVNYNCRTGFCGACKTKVLKGSVEYLRDPLYKLQNNEILTCCSRAKEDLAIAFDDKVNVFQSAYAITL